MIPVVPDRTTSFLPEEEFMAHKNLNRIVAAVVFLVTLAVYLRTLSCTVVFWDVGEFIAAAKLMQVPHPPGSPLFLYWARVAMMIPFAGDQAGDRLNSATASNMATMFCGGTSAMML